MALPLLTGKQMSIIKNILLRILLFLVTMPVLTLIAAAFISVICVLVIAVGVAATLNVGYNILFK